MRLTGRRCAAVVLVALLGLVGCSIQPGLAVTLQAPSNGGSVSSLTPILSWEASGSPASYRLQVASDSGFQDLVLDQTLSGPSYTVPSGKLKDSQSYYWRVSASRGTDTSGWTPYWVFQTRVSTDTITVSATLDGSPWSGTVNYSLTGPKSGSSSSVPETFSDLETGSYTLSYASGGPPGARLASITPSASATLSPGSSIAFTMNFQSEPVDTVLVYATLDGASWSGLVNYTVHGPKSGSSSSVPETFSGLPEGTYTISYSSGGPAGATLSGIGPSPTQVLRSGGTVAFTFNFHSEATGSIKVKATLDGARWSGKVRYSIDGPTEDSSSSAPDTFGGLPGGTYTISYRSGGPDGATLVSVTPQPTQTLDAGGTVTFTFNFHSSASGIVKVKATLDGEAWSGRLQCSIHGPKADSCYKVPYSLGNMPGGTYTVGYSGGGPSGATLVSVTPQPTQTIYGDDSVTFTLNFHSQGMGSIVVEATLDGSPWRTAIGSGAIDYTITGPRSDSNQTVPETFDDVPAGTYTLSYNSGGPIGATLSSISPAPRQTLEAGGVITFTLEFHSEATGTVLVDATVNGEPWSGTVKYTLAGPYVDSDNTVPRTFSDCPAGSYTLSYTSGGPEQCVLEGITPSPSQRLPSGGMITFTLNFVGLLKD